MIITPTASATVESIAMAASPRICPLLMRSTQNASAITITSVNGIGEFAMLPHRFAMPARRLSGRNAGSDSAVTKLNEAAMDSAPNPTCDSPSPIIE